MDRVETLIISDYSGLSGNGQDRYVTLRIPLGLFKTRICGNAFTPAASAWLQNGCCLLVRP